MGNNPSLYKTFGKNQFQPGSTVVITGASSGMGKELAFRYAKRNCNVVIGARRIEILEEIKNECELKYGNTNVVPVAVDVSDESQSRRLIETAVEKFGGIDLLVLCAGISAHSLFEDFDDMSKFR